jgi:hypothetical protein
MHSVDADSDDGDAVGVTSSRVSPSTISARNESSRAESLLNGMTFHQTDEHVSIQLEVSTLFEGGKVGVVTPVLEFEVSAAVSSTRLLLLRLADLRLSAVPTVAAVTMPPEPSLLLL